MRTAPPPMTPPDAARSPEDDRRLATVRGLLAKAEATEFPEEAEAFFAKASELIARYALDEAEVWAAEDGASRAVPEELVLTVERPYLSQKGLLVGAVAAAHGCRTVTLPVSESRDGRSMDVSVVGFASDLRWVETLVTSLLLQMARALHRAQPPGLTATRSAAWRRSFIVGFAEEVGRRLELDRAAASRTAEASTALVLVDREARVAEDVRRRYPHVRTRWISSGSSVAGRDAGLAAGREAALTRDAVGGRRRLRGG